MSGTFTLLVQEAAGPVAVPGDIDATAIVVGPTSVGGSGVLSAFFFSIASAIAAVGYGDAVDDLCQIIGQVQADGATGNQIPAAIYSSLSDGAAGACGTPVTSGITGSASAHASVAGAAYGTYQVWAQAVGTITVGTSGVFVWSLDGGVTISNQVNLGTSLTFLIPNSNVTITFGQAANVWNNGDTLTCPTTAPQMSSTDITSACTAIAQSSVDFAILVFEVNMTATLCAAVSTGLSTLLAAGKHACAIVHTRLPNFATPETDAAWNTSVGTDYASFNDSRIVVRAAYGLVKDAATGRQYLRSTLQQFVADIVRVPRSTWPCAPADQAEANVSLVNASGTTVGHDEGPRGASTGLSNPTIGNRFSCEQRLPISTMRELVFNTMPWTAFPPSGQPAALIQTLMVRRIANAMERDAIAAGASGLGGKIFYTPADPTIPGSQPMLTATSRDAVHAVLFDALSEEFADDIQNASDGDVDKGLVQVNPIITVSAGQAVAISVVLAPLVFGYLLSLSITLAVQE